jgi:hypothetical protein
MTYNTRKGAYDLLNFKLKYMDYEKEITEIDKVINQLKLLRKELICTKNKSEKSFNANGTIKQRQKASVDLDWQCMALDKQRKATWKTILEADLEVSLDDCEYNLSAFHSYKHVVK